MLTTGYDMNQTSQWILHSQITHDLWYKQRSNLFGNGKFYENGNGNINLVIPKGLPDPREPPVILYFPKKQQKHTLFSPFAKDGVSKETEKLKQTNYIYLLSSFKTLEKFLESKLSILGSIRPIKEV